MDRVLTGQLGELILQKSLCYQWVNPFSVDLCITLFILRINLHTFVNLIVAFTLIVCRFSLIRKHTLNIPCCIPAQWHLSWCQTILPDPLAPCTGTSPSSPLLTGWSRSAVAVRRSDEREIYERDNRHLITLSFQDSDVLQTEFFYNPSSWEKNTEKDDADGVHFSDACGSWCECLSPDHNTVMPSMTIKNGLSWNWLNYTPA